MISDNTVRFSSLIPQELLEKIGSSSINMDDPIEVCKTLHVQDPSGDMLVTLFKATCSKNLSQNNRFTKAMIAHILKTPPQQPSPSTQIFLNSVRQQIFQHTLKRPREDNAQNQRLQAVYMLKLRLFSQVVTLFNASTASPEDLIDTFVGIFQKISASERSILVDFLSFLSNRDEQTELHYAAIKAFLKVGGSIKSLIYKEARISLPVHIAIRLGKRDLVEQLLDAGADIHQKDTDGSTLLEHALIRKHGDLALFLIERGATLTIREREEPILALAARTKNLSLVQLLIDKGADVNEKDRSICGKPILLTAIENGTSEIAQLLIKNGANIHAVDSDLKTALHYASNQEDKDLVELLISRGVDVNATTELRQETALHLIAKTGKDNTTTKEIVELLIKNGADLNAQEREDYTTPLHHAIWYGKSLLATFLIEAGADITLENGDGEIALHLAVQSNNREITTLLLNKGANINALSENEWTPLHYATHPGSKEIAQLLLNRGADIEAQDTHSKTPLLHAISNGDKEIIEFFIAQGANLEAVDDKGKGVLDRAIHNENIEFIEWLLQKTTFLNNPTSTSLLLKTIPTMIEKGKKDFALHLIERCDPAHTQHLSLISPHNLQWAPQSFDEILEGFTRIENLNSPEEKIAHYKKARKIWFAMTRNVFVPHTNKIEMLKNIATLFSQEDHPHIHSTINTLITTLSAIEKNYHIHKTHIDSFSKEIVKHELPPFPATFICPITQVVMKYPMKDIYGHTYEQSAITEWIEQAGTSPIMRGKLTLKDLTPDTDLQKTIRLKVEKKLILCQEKQEDLEKKMIEILQLEESTAQERKQEIAADYAEYEEQKIELAQLLYDNWILAMTKEVSLEPGTKLYHATTEESIISIITNGIQKEVQHTFGEPVMGKGLYLSLEGGSYLDDTRNCLIVFEVVQPLSACTTKPLAEYKLYAKKMDIAEDEIVHKYAVVQKKYPALIHAGLPPANSELVLQNPLQKVQIVGVAINTQENKPAVIPLDQFCKSKGITSNSQWA